MSFKVFGIAPVSVKLRVKLFDSATSQGKTGIVRTDANLRISTIQDGIGSGISGEAAPVVYQGNSTIEDISILGQYQAPSASNCRFKEVSAANHPGLYEIHLADARLVLIAPDAARPMVLMVSISGVTGMSQQDLEIECGSTTAAVWNTAYSTHVTAGTFGEWFYRMMSGVGTRVKMFLAQLNIVATGNDPAMELRGSGSGSGLLTVGGATGYGQYNSGVYGLLNEGSSIAQYNKGSADGATGQRNESKGTAPGQTNFSPDGGYGVENIGIIGQRNYSPTGIAQHNDGVTVGQWNSGVGHGLRNTASAGIGQSNEGGTNSEGMKNTGAGSGAGQSNTGGIDGNGQNNIGGADNGFGQINYSPTRVGQKNNGQQTGQENSGNTVIGQLNSGHEAGQKNLGFHYGQHSAATEYPSAHSAGQFNEGSEHGTYNKGTHSAAVYNEGRHGTENKGTGDGDGLKNTATGTGFGQSNLGSAAGVLNTASNGPGMSNIGGTNGDGMKNTKAGTGKDISAPINDLGLNNGTALTAQQVRDAMALGTAAGAAAGSVDKHLDDLLVDSTAIKTATTSPMAEITVVPGANPTPTQALMLMYQKDSSKLMFHRDSDTAGNETIFTNNNVARMKREFTDDGTNNIFTKLENV